MQNISPKIKKLFFNPSNVGILDRTKPSVHFAEIITPDKTTHIQLFINLENNKITDAKFKALGCPTTIACLSFLTDYVKGHELKSLQDITAKFLIESLDISKEKYSVAGLVEELVKKFRHY